MSLLEVLNTHFSSSTEGIVDYFLINFGVNVKIEGNYYLFKYDQLAVKWGEVSFGCRGHILSPIGGWHYVSRPADKFFNLHEGHCPLFGTDENFHSFIPKMRAFNKLDGTCIQVWWDDTDWRVSTLGTITPMKVGDTPFTFTELFWKSVNKNQFHGLSATMTYVFELCSPYNRIVTDYGDKIFSTLLYARDLDTGEYAHDELLDTIGEVLGVNRPFELSLDTITDRNSLMVFVESVNDESLGKNPEGVVVYIDGVPTAKCKTRKYLALHRFSEADPLCSRNSLIDLFLSGGVDDVYGDLSDRMKAFCDSMGSYFREVAVNNLGLIREVFEKKPETQKDYAMLVKDSPFSSILFKNKDKVLSGNFSEEDFVLSLRMNPSKEFIEKLKTLWTASLLTIE